MNKSDLTNFVASLIINTPEEITPITEAEAAYNLEQWKLEEWEDLPQITPQELTAEWNEQARITHRKPSFSEV